MLRTAIQAEAEGDSDAALDGYRRSIEIAPDHVPAHRRYQDLMSRLDRRDEVREEYRKRLQERSSAAEWCMLGRLEANPTLQDFRYRRALELDPDFVWAHYALAGVLRRKGQTGLALEHQRRAAAGLPDLPEVRLELAELLREMGQWNEAITEYEAYLGSVGRDLYVEECIAGCLLRLDRRDAARRAYRAIVTKRPDHVNAHLGLASIAIEEEKPRVAERHLSRAREIEPKRAEVYFNLGLLHEELLDDADGALEFYRKYLELDGEQMLRTQLRMRRLEREKGEG